MIRLLWTVWLVFAAAILLAQEPVGIRSNNPTNIHGVQWKEWGGATGTDEYHYLRFSTPQDGIRAALRIILAYHFRYGIDTVAGVANRWVRRPTTAAQRRDLRGYILAEARWMGCSPNHRLRLDDPAVDERLVKAIIFAENSEMPYTESVFESALVFGH